MKVYKIIIKYGETIFFFKQFFFYREYFGDTSSILVSLTLVHERKDKCRFFFDVHKSWVFVALYS